jgi:transposase
MINKNFAEYILTHSNAETAERFNVCLTTVWKWARKLGINRKTNRYKDLDCELTQKQEEILVGSLLGDGSLSKVELPARLSAYKEGHSVQQENYLLWKYEQLKPFSCRFKKEIRKTTIKGFDHDANKAIYSDIPHEFFVMNTIFHPIFVNLENKWYLRDKDGKYIFDDNGRRIKIVPKDINLTPLALAVWFFDDGHRNERDGQAYFSTLAFTFQECNFLVDQLKFLGITNCWVRDRYSKPDIAIGYSSYLYFINMIKPYLPDKCMEYKIDLANLKQTKYRYTMNEVLAKQIITLKNNGMRQSEIAKELNISKYQVNRFIMGKTWKKYQSF